MKAKLSFLAGIAVGYVLGARAGRGSYEKIKASAKAAWSKDAVQDTVSTVQDTVKDQAADTVHKLVHRITPSGQADPGAGAVPLGMEPKTSGGNPLDIVPGVSDEFPDATLPSSEGPTWQGKEHPTRRLPEAEN